MFKKGLQLLSIFILINSSSIFAQETKLESGKEYILAKIDVTGKISYNEQTVTTFTGLEKGPDDQYWYKLKDELWSETGENSLNSSLKKVILGNASPYHIADEIIKEFKNRI